VISVVDSGLGGLSVAFPLVAALSTVPIAYLADQAFAPYGERSQDELIHRLALIIHFFQQQGAALMVLACNTASVNAIDALRHDFPSLQFVGMEPAVKPAASTADKIVVLGTNSTVRNARHRTLVDAHASGKTVWHVGAPELVRQVEAGELNRLDHLERLLQPYVDQGAEALVIGCSHFSFLRPAITRRWPRLQIFDGADGVVRRTIGLAEPLAGSGGAGRQYWTTGSARTVQFVSPPLAFAHIDLEVTA
jgi:glutamate racemase